MLYPLSYRGIDFNGLGMLTLAIDLVNRVLAIDKKTKVQRANEKRSPERGDLFAKRSRDKRLGRAGLVLCFRKHATTIQRIVDDLAYCRSFRINVHPVARLEMSDDAFGRYLESHAVQLRKAARLNMIDSHKPLV
jgi:hypothetical protein